MKSLLVMALLLVVSGSVLAESYPESGRFVNYNIKNTPMYILKDTKTGCEYLYGSGPTAATLVEGSCTNLPAGASK